MRTVLRRRLPGSLVVVTIFLALWIGATGTAAAEYPVDYNLFSGVPGELEHPGGSLPGSNDRFCRPSAAHPDPVVLVHGTGGGAQTNWGVYVPLLANAGYCVYALTYGAYDNLPWPVSAIGGMRPIQDSAAQLAAFVHQVLATTGASKVDLIAHSQGNIVGNYYIKRLGGEAMVDKFVALAAPWVGTFDPQTDMIRAFARQLGVEPAVDAMLTAGACLPCGQMVGHSAFLRRLNADGVYDRHVTYTNIETRYDELIVPFTVGVTPGPGVTQILLQDGCPVDYSEHAGLVADARAAGFALNALDPAHPRPVPCHLTLPAVGG
ncbi:esterase/lipase family protein [Nocardia alni]|uniref:esterase/lipase family protein n=1 Tax=Nocardia alni TaxID=2815723 RepID=UPI001C232C03|nr:alpha/beta fold hydrolase [Nocardia alni]